MLAPYLEELSIVRTTRWILVAAGCLAACSGNNGQANSNTSGTSSTGGNGSASGGTGNGAGATSQGGRLGTGGTSAAGGTVSRGGTSPTGGTTSAAGTAGSGCMGNFEIIQNSTGLCVAKMATVAPPSGYSDYSIDVTEVTKGQYDLWLATNPELPVSTDPNCGWKSTGSYAEQASGGALYSGTDADHHPVADVDWCDADEYCAGVGKRLCGAIGGGPVDYAAGYPDTNVSQWGRVCTSTGTNAYPYGNTYVESTCDGYDYWNDNSATATTVAVGSLSNCETAAGVYDLSGNVSEWEDRCNSTGQYAVCIIRGGAFNSVSNALTCSAAYNFNRNLVDYGVGFRCCAP